MNTKQYIKQLRKELNPLKKKERDIILKEIQSHIDESHLSYNLLCEKFGTPEHLAKSYLEDISIDNKDRAIMRYLKKFAKFIGIVLSIIIVIIIAIIIAIMYFSKDLFNYNEYDKLSIFTKIQTPWVQVHNIQDIKIQQSKVIIYWSYDDSNVVHYSCKDNTDVTLENDELFMKQSYCYIVLPKQSINIRGYQSSLVGLEPTVNTYFDLEQSRLEIAENNIAYTYTFDISQTKVSDLESKQSPVTIDIQAYQSRVSDYTY